MAKVKNHQNVDWSAYFASIQQACPWSYRAWTQGLIDIVTGTQARDLGQFEARIYVTDLSRRRLKKLCQARDQGVDAWLWSDPEHGPMATPVPCLIQQPRARLEQLRARLAT